MAGGPQGSTEQRSSRTRVETSNRGANGASTGSGTGSSWTAEVMGQDDQDLSGDDLKYVIWSIVFTRPGFECVLEPQHEEIVNYSADGASFAAIKIAKFLEKARHGRAAKPELWNDSYPPAPSKVTGRRTESIAASTATGETGDFGAGAGGTSDKGWRIPAEDQKYITFLYRVERRLPKQEVEVTRVERVTVERGTAKI